MSDEKILSFPGADIPENPIQKESSAPFVFCQHEQISLDSHTRTVSCLRCRAVLDPFNFLLMNASHLQTAWTRYAEVQKRISEKHEQIEMLTKEERRLKGRVKTAQEKERAAGFIIDVRGSKP